MNQLSKTIVILFIFLCVITLAGCTVPSVSEDTGSKISAQNAQSSFGSQGNAPKKTYWITIDPLPIITPGKDFTVSGLTNLETKEGMIVRVIQSASSANVSGCLRSGKLGASLVVFGTSDPKVWSTDVDAPPCAPDQYTVHASAVQRGVYSTAMYPFHYHGAMDNNITFWIRLNPLVKHSLNSNFTISGSTNLPVGYPIEVEIFPGVYTPEDFGSDVDYHPLIKNIISVIPSADGSRIFSMPVNLTADNSLSAILLNPGEYFTEVHAINMNSSVSDNTIFLVTMDSPWVSIDPIDEPAEGANLTISGTTNLPPGDHVTIEISTVVHPCRPAPQSLLSFLDTGSSCGGSTCKLVDLHQTAQVKGASSGENLWKIEVTTENWCKDEKYIIRASTNDQIGSGNTHKYFGIRSA